ncbi:MAG: exonuclease domain-containing protein [Acholeplasmatales bacterium]|jgi:sporulation inhibitor KapD|nr:exonuclease domain-containing protein [Acholeplasmataceae bacterium]MDY0114937.1 exonuclease domain-containing protein [Acholeplasmatales bacterium]MCK9234470.1 exonuclease domain-containing protein [Acholeplasmataceae bacterium]MCK9289498.1 exonuclease domain-containing protein [Acholeplasmataceae bacterium]MCK9427123.1 exonuclease domain-containing protein [Acholeplasmataceae bacterium]
MKRRIHQVNEKESYFSVIFNGRLIFIYLTKRQRKRYLDYLESGRFVTFRVSNKTKKIKQRRAYYLKTITKVERPTKGKTIVLYDFEKIKREIVKVITSFDYYLFIDLESTMPHYYRKKFEAEIIQIGYYLTNKEFDVIKKQQYYLLPTKYPKISVRTFKFLNINDDVFKTAKPYQYFYRELKELLATYQAKIVVWGRNDILSLNRSYRINNLKSITKRSDFINLLEIHKSYYDLTNDLGLFKAFQFYYGKNEIQEHDALQDALILLEVFKGLKKTNYNAKKYS